MSIDNKLNIDISFVVLGTWSVEILMINAEIQICCHLQSRALTFRPKQNLLVNQSKQLKMRKNLESWAMNDL